MYPYRRKNILTTENAVENLETVLKGKTLRVYWWLVKNPGPHTGREVQRNLNLSSPSLSIYHIEKLKTAGLVVTDVDGRHSVVREVRVGVLQFFLGKGRFHFPRYLFYSVFYTVILISLPLALPIVTYVVVIFGVVTSWFETLRMWRFEPF
jgi:hypothetical protein